MGMKEDVVLRCVYILDPERPQLDPELDSIDMGNGPGLPAGVMKFVFESRPPTQVEIERGGGLQEASALYLSAEYRGKEFCRVGYFVRYEYTDPALREEPPAAVDWSKLQRVLSDPCITFFENGWDAPARSSTLGP